LAIVFVIITAELRNINKSWAALSSVSFTVVVILVLLPQLAQIISTIRDLSALAGVNYQYIVPILKTLGVVYITTFGSEICRDADEDAMAMAVELAGKIVILIVALPIMQAILTSVLGILD